MKEIIVFALLALAVLFYSFQNLQTVEIIRDKWYMWEWSHGGYPARFYGYAELPFTIMFNNPNQYWMGNVSQQGLLKYCDKAEALRDFEVDKDIENLYLTIKYKINNAYGEIVHVGVALYILLDKNYLAIDLLLYANDIFSENYWYNEAIDPDYHAQFKIVDSEFNKWYELNVDVSKYIRKAMNYWNIGKGKLAAVQLYIDGVKSYGEAEFKSCRLEHRQAVDNTSISEKIILLIAVAIILIFLIKILKYFNSITTKP
jgi:hypothetical protein